MSRIIATMVSRLMLNLRRAREQSLKRPGRSSTTRASNSSGPVFSSVMAGGPIRTAGMGGRPSTFTEGMLGLGEFEVTLDFERANISVSGGSENSTPMAVREGRGQPPDETRIELKPMTRVRYSHEAASMHGEYG
jgi:hypothetical protein